jgi:hypothetical protein
MTVYKRNTTSKLLLLRLSFMASIFLCFYLFNQGLNDYAFVLVVLIIFCSVIPVTTLKIEEDAFTVRQFYFYGFISRSHTFIKGDNVIIQPFDLELSDAGYLSTDSAWDIVTVMLPIATVTLKRFIIKYKSLYGDHVKIKMKLSQEEYGLIQNLLLH